MQPHMEKTLFVQIMHENYTQAAMACMSGKSYWQARVLHAGLLTGLRTRQPCSQNEWHATSNEIFELLANASYMLNQGIRLFSVHRQMRAWKN